jgi:HSP20 family protein
LESQPGKGPGWELEMKGIFMSTEVVQSESKSPARPAPETEMWLAPDVDIYETKEGYTILAEMPGVNKAGLEVTVDGNELTILGRRNLASLGNSLHCEIRNAQFRRVFELDPVIETSKIAARMEQGLLILFLPKAEKPKPRRISVEG